MLLGLGVDVDWGKLQRLKQFIRPYIVNYYIEIDSNEPQLTEPFHNGKSSYPQNH